MAQTYTIWFNTSFLKITSPQFTDVETEMLYDKIIKTQEELNALLECNSELFDEKSSSTILISVKEPTVTLNEFKSKLKLINAGGGIVFNANNQLLLIKRKGFWDLPKGKAEPNEKIRTTAIREVEEETGVHVETASEQAMITYHCYKMKGECCIKETHWFEMTTTSVEQHLTPQTEEDIEQVIWAEVSDLPAFKDEMYPMIWSILEAYLIAL